MSGAMPQAASAAVNHITYRAPSSHEGNVQNDAQEREAHEGED
eukprot:CAMPEP_0118883670 /NCGR_PEP_ID=MMETSP1163-20130328/22710_1 /TAXON_ID=124430 /ORGANISM="Phaeomonas parva, Strain CCMP2877" /LENGTH=42 /DNA_ID= /DNA_START= /DNA_END= /DNA_ORIENTATION=